MGGGLKVELELSKSIIGVCNVESIQGERFMAGFIKAIIPPKGYQFKTDNGNIINTTKIILEEKSDIQKFKYMKTDNLKEIVDILINYSEQLKELRKDVLKLQDEVSSLKIKLLSK